MELHMKESFIHWASGHYRLLNISLLVVSCMPALFASKRVLIKLKHSVGMRSALALMELIVLWLLPLLTFIATEASEARLSPRNQPLATVTVLVRLELGPTGPNFERQKASPLEDVAQLQIGQSKRLKRVGSEIIGSGPWDVFLVSDKFTKWGNETSTTYFLEFHVVPFLDPVNYFTGDAALEDLIHQWDVFMMNTWFLPRKTEILGGSITVTMNATVQKNFPIPPQSTDDFARITYFAPNP